MYNLVLSSQRDNQLSVLFNQYHRRRSRGGGALGSCLGVGLDPCPFFPKINIIQALKICGTKALMLVDPPVDPFRPPKFYFASDVRECNCVNNDIHKSVSDLSFIKRVWKHLELLTSNLFTNASYKCRCVDLTIHTLPLDFIPINLFSTISIRPMACFPLDN